MNHEDIVFSNHAQERLQTRHISRGMVYEAIRNPERSILEDDGDTKFIATVHGCNVHVVCKPIEKGRWLVKTVFIRGEDDGDAYSTYKKQPITRHPLPRESTLKPSRPFDMIDLLTSIAFSVIVGGIFYYFATR
mgnify:CR=1 FL=1